MFGALGFADYSKTGLGVFGAVEVVGTRPQMCTVREMHIALCLMHVENLHTCSTGEVKHASEPRWQR